jgi:hypothetical protein
MDLMIVEPLDPDVVQWLEVRYQVQYAPGMAREPIELRRSLAAARAIIVPPSVAVDEALLRAAPQLRAVGRLSAGAENVDLDACARAGVEVVRPTNASAAAEAEFAIAALLQLLRRVPVVNAEGLLVGRELGAAQVGLVGMTPAARPLAKLLGAFGAQVVGYDPALHAFDPLWAGWGVRALPLRELFEQCDAVCVMLSYFTRYRGLIGDRFLGHVQDRSGAGQPDALDRLRRGGAGRCAGQRAHRRGLVRQPGTRRAGRRPSAAAGAEPAGHAARGRHHARVAPAWRLGGGAPHRRDPDRAATARRLQPGVASRRR